MKLLTDIFMKVISFPMILILDILIGVHPDNPRKDENTLNQPTDE